LPGGEEPVEFDASVREALSEAGQNVGAVELALAAQMLGAVVADIAAEGGAPTVVRGRVEEDQGGAPGPPRGVGHAQADGLTSCVVGGHPLLQDRIVVDQGLAEAPVVGHLGHDARPLRVFDLEEGHRIPLLLGPGEPGRAVRAEVNAREEAHLRAIPIPQALQGRGGQVDVVVLLIPAAEDQRPGPLPLQPRDGAVEPLGEDVDEVGVAEVVDLAEAAAVVVGAGQEAAARGVGGEPDEHALPVAQPCDRHVERAQVHAVIVPFRRAGDDRVHQAPRPVGVCEEGEGEFLDGLRVGEGDGVVVPLVPARGLRVRVPEEEPELALVLEGGAQVREGHVEAALRALAGGLQGLEVQVPHDLLPLAGLGQDQGQVEVVGGATGHGDLAHVQVVGHRTAAGRGEVEAVRAGPLGDDARNVAGQEAIRLAPGAPGSGGLKEGAGGVAVLQGSHEAGEEEEAIQARVVHGRALGQGVQARQGGGVRLLGGPDGQAAGFQPGEVLVGVVLQELVHGRAGQVDGLAPGWAGDLVLDAQGVDVAIPVQLVGLAHVDEHHHLEGTVVPPGGALHLGPGAAIVLGVGQVALGGLARRVVEGHDQAAIYEEDAGGLVGVLVDLEIPVGDVAADQTLVRAVTGGEVRDGAGELQ